MFSCFVLIDPLKTGLNSLIWSAWRKEEEIGNWRTCHNKCTNNRRTRHNKCTNNRRTHHNKCINNRRTCRNKCTNNIPKKKEYRILEKHCEVKFEIGANISEGRAT